MLCAFLAAVSPSLAMCVQAAFYADAMHSGNGVIAGCTSGAGSQSQCGSCSCLPWNQEFDDCTSGEATIPEFRITQPETIKRLP
jgi:hypothetical protein